MAIAPGTHLGPYEITAAIGAGGMGEVYRARDAKLGRDVALKVLPEAFAHDADRMARFQREATLLAALNSPNIASIYGLEDSGGTRALVMELVEGPTLAERISQGPIPIDETLRIAKQICEALEYAHERGIVHRDLKPANVKLMHGDTVKLLDFGLAKALDGYVTSAYIENSPTITQMTTQAGGLFGTAAYMAPEQANGRPADLRSDIWAFGCVLYELLTLRMVFHGKSVASTLAAVLKEEPDWSILPAATPVRVRILLRQCMQKDPKKRLQAIGDARIALDEVLSGVPDLADAIPHQTRSRQLWLVSGLACLVTAVVVAFGVWNLKPSPPPRKVTRFTITLPSGQQLAGLPNPALALSADGSQLCYVAASQAGTQHIYLRAMDDIVAKAIPGTEGATDPFFSPDGQWLGFFADGKLKKISMRGATAQTLLEIVNPLGASWGNHTIVLAPYSSVLQQISDGGGASQSLTHFEKGETTHTWPSLLPDSKAVLFTALSASPPTIAVQPIRLGERRNLIQGQGVGMPRYASSGHLIYAQAGNLMAVPFDVEHLELKGEPISVVQDVLQFPDSGAAQFSISSIGSLAYVPGAPQNPQCKLVWVRRNGIEQTLGAPARSYNQPRLSPDGKRVAVDVIENIQGMQVWLYDFARDTLAPFTFEGVNRHPVWTPDGRRVAFMSNREGPTQLFWQLADGSGGPERLTNNAATSIADILPIPYSWSPDGELLVFVQLAPTTGAEFWALHVHDGKTQRFLQTRTLQDGAPQFSPDGRWFAYVSDESGRKEIYVRPFPGPGGKWQVSNDGGSEPQWNHNGRELFYRNGDRMMAVDITAQASFAVGKPRQLFEGHYLSGGGYARANYDVSPDGQRFLMLRAVEGEQAAPTQINVVLNWTEELKRLVPTEKK